MLPPAKERSRSNNKFQILKALEPVPPKLKRPPRPLWISTAYIWFVDKRAALSWNPCHSEKMVRGITRSVCRSVMADYWRRAEEASTDIGTCLEPSTGGADPHGAYAILKRWYRHVSTRAPNPSRTDMENIRGDFQTLYQRD